MGVISDGARRGVAKVQVMYFQTLKVPVPKLSGIQPRGKIVEMAINAC